MARRLAGPLSPGLEELKSMIGQDMAITAKAMLTAPGLAVRDKVFAFEHDGGLVLKLPRETVSALVASGEGRPFGTPGRIMKEWVALPMQRPVDQHVLARAALLFVAETVEPAGKSR